MNVEYKTSLAQVTASATTGGYEWSYEEKNGETRSEIADTAHITAWTEINEINIEEPTDVTLFFSKAPEKVTALRWADNPEEADAESSDGENVKTAPADEPGQFTIERGAGIPLSYTCRMGKRLCGIWLPYGVLIRETFEEGRNDHQSEQ